MMCYLSTRILRRRAPNTVHRDRLPTVRNQFGSSAFGHVDVDVDDRHTGALVQGTRECPAEADGGAGNEGGAPAESHTISAVGGAIAVVSILTPSGVSWLPSLFIAALYSGRTQNPECPQIDR